MKEFKRSRALCWGVLILAILMTPFGVSAFDSIALSGLRSRVSQLWHLHTGFQQKYDHSHAISRLFPRSIFVTHPEWLPMVKGQRYEFESERDYNWQPDYTKPEVALYAAERVKEFFRANPEAPSVSISVNDLVNYGDQVLSHEEWGPVSFFRSRPDCSALYFQFANRVAEEVEKEFPNKKLGCYAYYWTEAAPPFAIHSNLVPYLTADRTQWYDAEFRREDKKLIQNWLKANANGSGEKGDTGATIGCYDYSYGANYCYPRIFDRALIDSITFMKDQGVRGYYAEIGPIWGFDRGKMEILRRQLKGDTDSDRGFIFATNPGRRARELSTIYRDIYGEAAVPMRRFFGVCESIHTNQPGPVRWIRGFQEEAQMGIWNESAIRACRRHLESAKEAARQPWIVQAIRETEEAWSFTELAWDLWVRRQAIENQLALCRCHPVNGGFPALSKHPCDLGETQFVQDLGSQWQAARNSVESRLKAGFSDANAPLSKSEFLFFSNPLPRLSHAHRGHSKGPGVSNSVAPMGAIPGGGKDPNANLLANADFASLRSRDFIIPLMRDRIFASGFQPADWNLSYRPWEHVRLDLIEGGKSPFPQGTGFRTTGSSYARLWQEREVTPGAIYTASVQVTGQTRVDSLIYLSLEWRDAAGKSMGLESRDRLMVTSEKLKSVLMMSSRAPERAGSVRVILGASHQLAEHQVVFHHPTLIRNSMP